MHYETATALAAKLDAGEFSARELTDQLLARIACHEPRLNACAHVLHDRARTAADASDARRTAGTVRSRFDGVPVVLKDIIDLEGAPTGGGSVARETTWPTTSATLATRLEAAGLVVLGKTHTVEFAMGGWGTNNAVGTPWNPWDPDVQRAPGGSSSGTGVAVAAGYAPWGIGTDTGGSVRLPSAWNGLIGLKCTFGRVSCAGVLPLSRTLDTPGPLARSVEDAAALYDLIHGPDARDANTRNIARNDVFPALRAGIEGMELARVPHAELARASSAVRDAYRESLARLRSLGARIIDVALPATFEALGNLTGRVIAAEGFAEWGHLTGDPSSAVDDDIRPRLAAGESMTAREYYHALGELARIEREMEIALGNADALVLPTVATAAPPVDSIDQSDTPAWFTRPANAAGMCALALPCGFDGGLPLSLQIVCRAYEEATALRIGYAFERDASAVRHPPLD